MNSFLYIENHTARYQPKICRLLSQMGSSPVRNLEKYCVYTIKLKKFQATDYLIYLAGIPGDVALKICIAVL